MDIDKNYPKRTAFRNMLRNELPTALSKFDYQLTYDNATLADDDNARWIFRLAFRGKETLEVRNRDWRDYTEYFHLSINGNEFHMLNIDRYENIGVAYCEVEAKFLSLIQGSRPTSL